MEGRGKPVATIPLAFAFALKAARQLAQKIVFALSPMQSSGDLLAFRLPGAWPSHFAGLPLFHETPTFQDLADCLRLEQKLQSATWALNTSFVGMTLAGRLQRA